LQGIPVIHDDEAISTALATGSGLLHINTTLKIQEICCISLYSEIYYMRS